MLTSSTGAAGLVNFERCCVCQSRVCIIEIMMVVVLELGVGVSLLVIKA
jgi:hypothetical protein